MSPFFCQSALTIATLWGGLYGMGDFALWDAPPSVNHVVMNGNKLK